MKKALIVAAVLAAGLALSACSTDTSASSGDSAAPAAKSTTAAKDTTAKKDAAKKDTAKKDTASKSTTRTVTYDVTGSGTKATSVTYLTFNDGGSSQAQATDAAIPFHKAIPIKDAGLFSSSIFSLVAQAGDGDSITCKITVDGKVIQTQTSTGQYSVVTCSGSAG